MHDGDSPALADEVAHVVQPGHGCLTMLSDIFPTGYHGCVSAGVTTGSTVYIAGAGPVGLAAAHSAQLLGAAEVIVGDIRAVSGPPLASFPPTTRRR